jgi:hypothetical protein
MDHLCPLPPELFFARFFASQAARDGAVIRRKIRDVENMIGRQVFLAEMRRRGFPVIENAGQFVVFCNREPMHRLV